MCAPKALANRQPPAELTRRADALVILGSIVIML